MNSKTSIDEITSWLGASKRVWIDCSSSYPAEEVDRVCTFLLQNQVTYGFLDSSPGSLVSNLTVIENLWLPVSWHRKLSVKGFYLKIDESAMCINEFIPDFNTLLCLMPSELTLYQRNFIVLLRAFIMHPEALIISSSWFSFLSDCQDYMFAEAMQSLFPVCSWLLFSDAHPCVEFKNINWERCILL